MVDLFQVHGRTCKREGLHDTIQPLSISGRGLYQISQTEWDRFQRNQRGGEVNLHVGIKSLLTGEIVDCFNNSTPYRIIPQHLRGAQASGKEGKLILILSPALQTFLFLDVEHDVPSSEEVYYLQNSELDAVMLVEKKWRIISAFEVGLEEGQLPEHMSQLEQKLAFFVILVWGSNQSEQIRREIITREDAFISHTVSNPRVISLHLLNLERGFTNPNYRRTLSKEWCNLHL